ncbi:hypothetical protein TRSC58_07377 [Trypanosoma rangeli SC58]|uniref:Uncharacterized protein n=1 Tax=Trypanosoma rangeli SC58 TaxID=429131 RepID=A0A061IVG8_TRYRA|nr:hypothetical protein TRSC58_07377 [Trypanosoma rangeli SC58]
MTALYVFFFFSYVSPPPCFFFLLLLLNTMFSLPSLNRMRLYVPGAVYFGCVFALFFFFFYYSFSPHFVTPYSMKERTKRKKKEISILHHLPCHLHRLRFSFVFFCFLWIGLVVVCAVFLR